MSSTLPFKLSVVPLLIWLIAYVGKRWGPVAAGALSAFPVVVGPALIFIAIEQGEHFAATAAAGSSAAVLALIAFSLAYVWAARFWNWQGALGAAILAYSIAVLGVHWMALALYESGAIVLGILLFVRLLFPPWHSTLGTGKSLRFDVPLRMIVGGGLVFGLTIVANLIGPTWSGVFAMFPVTGSILLVFSHIYQGREFAINLIYGMFLGWCSISLFCVTVGALIIPLGILPTFVLSGALAVSVQVIAYWSRRLRTRS